MNTKYLRELIFFVLLLAISFQTNHSFALSHTVYFDYNQSHLSIHHQLLFDKYLDSISQLDNIISIKVNSYCDDIEYEKIVLNLSKKRSAYVMRKLQSRFKNNIIKNIHWCQTVDWNKLNTQQIDQQLKQYRRIDIVFNLRHTNSIEENPLTVQIGDRFTLDGILFEPNEDELLKESLPTLNTLFEELLKRPQLVIQIQGHIYYSDLQQEEISDPYTCLSAKRAKRIYDYLLSKGISPHRLSYIGFENLYPLDKGPKYDRRVEIEIVNI